MLVIVLVLVLLQLILQHIEKTCKMVKKHVKVFFVKVMKNLTWISVTDVNSGRNGTNMAAL